MRGLPTTMRSASSESSRSAATALSGTSSTWGAISYAAGHSMLGSSTAATNRKVEPNRSARRWAAAAAPADSGEPSTPTTIVFGHHSVRGARAISTEHGASCSKCVATEPSAMPTARLWSWLPTTARLALRRPSSARRESSGFPSSRRVWTAWAGAATPEARSSACRASIASSSRTRFIPRPAASTDGWSTVTNSSTPGSATRTASLAATSPALDGSTPQTTRSKVTPPSLERVASAAVARPAAGLSGPTYPWDCRP